MYRMRESQNQLEVRPPESFNGIIEIGETGQYEIWNGADDWSIKKIEDELEHVDDLKFISIQVFSYSSPLVINELFEALMKSVSP